MKSTQNLNRKKNWRSLAIKIASVVIFVGVISSATLFVNSKVTSSRTKSYEETGASLNSIVNDNNSRVQAARETAYIAFVQETIISEIYEIADLFTQAKTARESGDVKGADVLMERSKGKVNEVSATLSKVKDVPTKFSREHEELQQGIHLYLQAFNFTTVGTNEKTVFTSEGLQLLHQGNDLINKVLQNLPKMASSTSATKV